MEHTRHTGTQARGTKAFAGRHRHKEAQREGREGDRGRVVATELDLGGGVGGEEAELAAQVGGIGVLVLLVRHRKEDRRRQVAPLLECVSGGVRM